MKENKEIIKDRIKYVESTLLAEKIDKNELKLKLERVQTTIELLTDELVILRELRDNK